MRLSPTKIGQLLIIGFDGTEMSPRLASLLTKIQPAGVILFARNITGAAQTTLFCANARSASPRRFSLASILKAARWIVSAT